MCAGLYGHPVYLYTGSECINTFWIQCMSITYFEVTHGATNFVPLCNSITHQSIMLESYLNPQKARSCLLVCNEKYFLVLFFCGWCHKWGRFLAILAQVT